MKKIITFSSIFLAILSLSETTGNIKVGFDLKKEEIQRTKKNLEFATKVESEINLSDNIYVGTKINTLGQTKNFPYFLKPGFKNPYFPSLNRPDVKKIAFADSSIYTGYKDNNIKAKLAYNFNTDLNTNDLYTKHYLKANLSYENYEGKEYGLGADYKMNLFNYNLSPSLTLKGFYQQDIGKIKDLRLDVSTETTFKKLNYIQAQLTGRYKEIDNTVIVANADFYYKTKGAKPTFGDSVHYHNDTMCTLDHSDTNGEHIHDEFTHFHGFRPNVGIGFEGEIDLEHKEYNIAHSYSLKAKYTGFDKQTIKAYTKFYHGYKYALNREKSEHRIDGLLRLEHEYKPIKNLEINSNIDLLLTRKITDGKKEHQKNVELREKIGAKYKYIVSENLLINSSLSLSGKHKFIEKDHYLDIKPKIDLEYMASDELKLTASIEDEINFAKSKNSNLEYKGHKFKVGIGAEYNW